MPNIESGGSAAGNNWNPLRRIANVWGRVAPEVFSRPPADPSIAGDVADGADSAADRNPLEPASADQDTPLYKPVVLVIEHIQDDAERIAVQLAEANFYPPLAATAAEGIALAKRVQPDIILVNQALPDLSGFRVVQRLAGDPATAASPAILVGRTDDPGTRAYALRAGAVSVLSKEDELSSALIKAVQRYRRLKPNGDQLESVQRVGAAKVRAIADIVAELAADPYLNERGKAAVLAAEVEAQFGFRATGGTLLDGRGRVLDDDHSWLCMADGWILDACIRRFRDAILGWPGAGDIAIIPPSSPLAGCYRPGR